MTDLLAEIAAIAGSHSFGVPGGGLTLEIADAIERSGGRFHTTRFEGAAALMAGAVGRLQGQAGVALCIKGPGFANLMSGLATCQLEDLPVLAVTEAYGRGDGPARAHKRLAQSELADAIVKRRCGIGKSGSARRLAAEAVAERPQPVVLELADVDESVVPTVGGPRFDTSAVLGAIARARWPVVIAGGLASRQGWSAGLNKLQLPVFSTAGAKGVVDERGTNAAGPYTGVGRRLAPETRILKEADLIVGLGIRTHEILAPGFNLPCVNVDDLELAPGFEFQAHAGTSDFQFVIDELLAKRGWGGDLIQACRHQLKTELLGGPFLPAHVFDVLMNALPAARIVLDTGYFCTIGEHMTTVSAPGLYLSSGQGRSMGASLPMAVGAAVADAKTPTVVAIGDGGIGMFFSELSLAVAEKAPLLVLLMNDGSMASIRDRAVAKGLSSRPLIFPGPEWASVGHAMGMHTAICNDQAGAEQFLQAWAETPRPALLEIRFDSEAYRTMTADLRN